MARSVRGWIRNLADGLGPPPGSVSVAATVLDDDATQDPLNAEEHGTGPLTFVHAAGSGDQGMADAGGHFGWDMEFSPGRITQHITPDDPQVEYRKRFPDESAPVGKAYHSDLERLAWTAGRDGLVWNAIPGGADPTAAQWSRNPNTTGGLGNWGVVAFGANLGFTLAKGIAFVGGTVFSIEAGDLAFPYPGATAAPPNTSPQDRWDLVALRVVTDPEAYNYGKQTIEVIPGIPGDGIPQHPGQPTAPTGRRLVLHALRVPANGSVYTSVFDLRRWLWMPVAPVTAVDPEWFGYSQNLTTNGAVDSVINTLMQLPENEIILPMGEAFAGELVFHSQVLAAGTSPVPNWGSINLSLIPVIKGIDVRGTILFDDPQITADEAYRIIYGPTNIFGSELQTIHVPIPRVPSYHVDSGITSPAGSRRWHILRPTIRFYTSGVGQAYPTVVYQRLSVRLWPLP